MRISVATFTQPLTSSRFVFLQNKKCKEIDNKTIERRMPVTISLELNIPTHEPISNSIMVHSLDNFLASIIQSYNRSSKSCFERGWYGTLLRLNGKMLILTVTSECSEFYPPQHPSIPLSFFNF